MWNKLSMKDKANYIKLAVQNNIKDLDTIREIYNLYAKGGLINSDKLKLLNEQQTSLAVINPNDEFLYHRDFADVYRDSQGRRYSVYTEDDSLPTVTSNRARRNLEKPLWEHILKQYTRNPLGMKTIEDAVTWGGNVAGASALAVGTAPIWLPYVAPAANMVGKAGKLTLLGLDWLFNPTTYRGTLLTSYTAAEGVDNFRKNPNIETGALAALGLLPVIPATINGARSTYNISKNLYNKSPKYSIGDTYYENDFEGAIPLYRYIKNKPYFKKFDAPFIEDVLAREHYIPIGKIEPDNFSRYLAERIIQNMKRLGFNPDKSVHTYYKGKDVLEKSSTSIRQIAKDPVTLYITKLPTNVAGFNVNSKAYVRLTPNTTEGLLASRINHEGISHNTDGIMQYVTNGVGSDQYSEITDALSRSKLYRLKDSTSWYELRATMTEFMRKMFTIHKNNSGTTYADVQDAVYKEIDDMPLEVMAKRFLSLNAYGRDYANYLRHHPSELNKFKELLKYGMGLGIPITLSQSDE